MDEDVVATRPSTAVKLYLSAARLVGRDGSVDVPKNEMTLDSRWEYSSRHRWQLAARKKALFVHDSAAKRDQRSHNTYSLVQAEKIRDE